MSDPSEIQTLDLIWGVAAIAGALKRTERATYHLLESGSLPVAKKIGGRWCVNRRKLLEMFEAAA